MTDNEQPAGDPARLRRMSQGSQVQPINPMQQLQEVLRPIAAAEETKARYQAEVDKAAIEADKEVRLKSLDVAKQQVSNVDEQHKRRVSTIKWGMLTAFCGFAAALVYSGVTGDNEPLKLLGFTFAGFLGGQGYTWKQVRDQEKSSPPGQDQNRDQ